MKRNRILRVALVGLALSPLLCCGQNTDIDLIRNAAVQGDAKAQCRLGAEYYLGQGKPQDYTEAEKWFRMAAEQGDAVAQRLLGLLYSGGHGITQDLAEAVKWTRKAAERGDAEAQSNLVVYLAAIKAAPVLTTGQTDVWPGKSVQPAPPAPTNPTAFDLSTAKPFDPDAFLAATPVATPPIPEGFVLEKPAAINSAPQAQSGFDRSTAKPVEEARVQPSTIPPKARQNAGYLAQKITEIIGSLFLAGGALYFAFRPKKKGTIKNKLQTPASTINFICPKCRHPLEAPADMGGEKIDCPNCSRPITIPRQAMLGIGTNPAQLPVDRQESLTSENHSKIKRLLESQVGKQSKGNQMNWNLLRILWVSIAVIGLLLLFPPWKFTVDIPRAAHIEKPGGYAFIFTPPESTSAIHYEKHYVSVQIDVGRLALPIVVVIMIAGALLFTVRGKNDHAPKE